MDQLGINQDTPVVTYDHLSNVFAHRVAFILQLYGHDNVRILDGGYKKWKEENLSCEACETNITASASGFEVDENLVRTYEQMRKISKAKSEQIIDARPAGVFSKGSIPGAVNINVDDLFESDGTIKSKEEIVAHFQSKALNIRKPFVTYCNTAMKATVVYQALIYAGAPVVAVYDGSWSEWGAKK